MRVGLFNFNRVSYQYYKDRLGEEEAVKAGELDALEEESVATNTALRQILQGIATS